MPQFLDEASRNQIVRFLLVGGGAFVVYFGLQYALEKAGLRPYASLSVAYVIALAYHYSTNYTFTFRNRVAMNKLPKSMAKYAVVNVGHYFITLGIVGFTRSLGFDMRLGMVAAVAVTMVTGYIAYRHWVFSI